MHRSSYHCYPYSSGGNKVTGADSATTLAQRPTPSPAGVGQAIFLGRVFHLGPTLWRALAGGTKNPGSKRSHPGPVSGESRVTRVTCASQETVCSVREACEGGFGPAFVPCLCVTPVCLPPKFHGHARCQLVSVHDHDVRAAIYPKALVTVTTSVAGAAQCFTRDHGYPRLRIDERNTLLCMPARPGTCITRFRLLVQSYKLPTSVKVKMGAALSHADDGDTGPRWFHIDTPRTNISGFSEPESSYYVASYSL